MTTRYRMLDEVDWAPLNGQTVVVEVSANWITFTKRDKTMLKIATAKRERAAKNGRPAPVGADKGPRALPVGGTGGPTREG